MKTGVLTFHNYDNYGAILQSYALQKVLNRFGVDAELIDYSCDFIAKPYRLINLRRKGLWNYIYGVIGHICYLPRKSACRRFRERLKYSQPVKKDDLRTLEKNYDLVIAGSDQIWDYSLTNFDRTYFLDFVEDPHKKCSYAASLGEHFPPESCRREIKGLLQDFEHLVVREEYVADELEKYLGKRPDTAVDPTLLLRGNEWDEIAKEPRMKKPYIAVYQLGISPKLVRFVKQLKKETGLSVVYIPFPLVGWMKCGIKVALGPTEWMGHLKNAEYVISDSFHGIAFSLLFHRRFFAMVKGHHRNRRVEELLKRVDLSERTVENFSKEMLSREIDYQAVDKKLEQMRRESLERLKRMVDHAV